MKGDGAALLTVWVQLQQTVWIFSKQQSISKALFIWSSLLLNGCMAAPAFLFLLICLFVFIVLYLLVWLSLRSGEDEGEVRSCSFVLLFCFVLFCFFTSKTIKNGVKSVLWTVNFFFVSKSSLTSDFNNYSFYPLAGYTFIQMLHKFQAVLKVWQNTMWISACSLNYVLLNKFKRTGQNQIVNWVPVDGVSLLLST